MSKQVGLMRGIINKIQNVSKFSNQMYILYIIGVLVALAKGVESQCCLQIQGKACISCSLGTHLYRGNCIIDIDFCDSYKDGFDCGACKPGYQLNNNGQCSLIPPLITLITDEIVDPKVQPSSPNNSLDLSKPPTSNVGVDVVSSGNSSLPVKQSPILGSKPTNSSNNANGNNTNNSNNVNNNNGNTGGSTLVFSPFNVASTDDFYLITLDFLGNQISKYDGIVPNRAQRAQTTLNTAFKIVYVLADGSNWEVTSVINTITYVLTVISENMISPPTKTITPVYEKLNINTLFADFQFILVAHYINTQSNNRYRDVPIKVAEKLQKPPTTLRYRIVFEVNGVQEEVFAQIDKLTLVTSDYQAPPPHSTPVTPVTPVNPGSTVSIITGVTPINPVKPPTPTPNPSTPLPEQTPKLNPKILSLVTGLTEHPASEFNNADFKSIDTLVRSVNSKQLAGTILTAAYYIEQASVRTYKIYYQRGQIELYEARVARDSLRKRNYVLGFTLIP